MTKGNGKIEIAGQSGITTVEEPLFPDIQNEDGSLKEIDDGAEAASGEDGILTCEACVQQGYPDHLRAKCEADGIKCIRVGESSPESAPEPQDIGQIMQAEFPQEPPKEPGGVELFSEAFRAGLAEMNAYREELANQVKQIDAKMAKLEDARDAIESRLIRLGGAVRINERAQSAQMEIFAEIEANTRAALGEDNQAAVNPETGEVVEVPAEELQAA